MPEKIAFLTNSTELGHVGRALGSSARPAWAIAVLASVLIFTTVVDVLGNLLVIISVFRNRKLRNAGELSFISMCYIHSCVRSSLIKRFTGASE
ncbi:hypothetical protein PO909_022543 [Leuciscus waleckii]